MNKIVLNIGLLVFFLSIIFFSHKGMLIEDVLLRSFGIFVVITIMVSVLAITFVKAINKTVKEKQQEQRETLMGTRENE